MVNSKRMSKSKVAMIALAILLVLSLILTATGAWFTYADTREADSAGNLVFRDNAMTLTLSQVGSSQVLRDEDGDGNFETTLVADLKNGTSDLMPGDKITYCDVSIAFAVAAGEDAWYIIKYDNKYYSAQGTEITAATGLKKVSEITGFASNAASLTWQGAEDITVPGLNTKNNAQGTAYDAAEIALGAIEVRMVQTENLSQANAYTYLTTGWDTPANPS